MVRLQFSVELNYQVLEPRADFIFKLQAARTRHPHKFAVQQFGTLWHDCGRVMAIRDWVTREVALRSNTSNGLATACNTLASKQGALVLPGHCTGAQSSDAGQA